MADHSGLFDGDSDSSSGDEGAPSTITTKAKPSASVDSSNLFADSDDDSNEDEADKNGTANADEDTPNETVAPTRYIDRTVKIPYADRPEDSASNPKDFQMLIAHLPNTVDVVPEPYAADQYDEADELNRLSQRGKQFAANSVIRWRVDDRTGTVESNARLVEYSDGSRVMFIGKEPFLAPTPRATSHSFVALNRKASHDDGTTSLAFEFQGRLSHQLQLKPVKGSAVSTLMALQVKQRAIESDKTGESYTERLDQGRRVVDVSGSGRGRRGAASGGRRAQSGAWRKDFLEQGAEYSSDEDNETSINAAKRKAGRRVKGRPTRSDHRHVHDNRSSSESEAVSTESSSSEEEEEEKPKRKRPPPRDRSAPTKERADDGNDQGEDEGRDNEGQDADSDDSDEAPQTKRKATKKIESDSESDS